MKKLVVEIENLSGKDVNTITDFLAKKFGFTGADYHAVNDEWVITAEGREPVATKTRKQKDAALQ